MEFFRVSDHSFHCTLTNDDLRDHDVTISDFLTNNTKVQEFLQEVMEMAHETIGFSPQQDCVALKMTVLPEGKLDIAFVGEKDEKQIGHMLVEALKSAGFPPLGSEERREFQKKRKSGIKRGIDHIILQFEDLDTISEFCARVYVGKPVNSDIYKNEKEGVYYLIMRKGRLGREYFERLETIGTEYGESMGNDLQRASYIAESFEPIITKRAVKIMSII